MNISSSTGIGYHYQLSSSSKAVNQQQQERTRSSKDQDSVQFSPEAKQKFEEMKGNMSSDFDPTEKLSAADKKDLLSKMKENANASDSVNSDMPEEMAQALSKVKDALNSVDLTTASDQDVSNLLSKVQATMKESMPEMKQGGGMPPMGGKQPGGTPAGSSTNSLNGSTSGNNSTQSALDMASNLQDDINGDGVVDDRDDTNGDGVVNDQDKKSSSDSEGETDVQKAIALWLKDNKDQLNDTSNELGNLNDSIESQATRG